MTNDEKINKALKYAWCYGQVCGEEHKMWVIDQMVRSLLENEEYLKWVERYETPDGEDYWRWKTGETP